MDVFSRMIEKLTHGTNQRATKDSASSQICCCVESASIMSIFKRLLHCVVLGVIRRWYGRGGGNPYEREVSFA